MKKLLTILFSIILLSSCNYSTINEDKLFSKIIEEEQKHLNTYKILRKLPDSTKNEYLDSMFIVLREDALKAKGTLESRDREPFIDLTISLERLDKYIESTK